MKIAFIPLRGGSKSIPLKNIKCLNNKPLALYTIEAALNSLEIDEVVVATDSQQIIDVVKEVDSDKLKVYRRKAENAQDHSSTESVMLEYLETATYADDDIFILIQATNPFVSSEDLTQGIKLLGEYDSIISCCDFKRFIWKEGAGAVNYDYNNRPRRQEFNDYYIENGAFYVSSVGLVKKEKNRLGGKIGYYVMPEYTSFEIDEPDDWKIIEMLMLSKQKEQVKLPKCIKLLLTDVDGVLTDAGMYYGTDGVEQKKFNTKDGMGISILRSKGIETGIITSENTQIVSDRAKKLNIKILIQGEKNKLARALAICNEYNITLDEVAYIGDDLNDKELLEKVGLRACPADAVNEIKRIPGIKILENKGGAGCVREFIDKHILD